MLRLLSHSVMFDFLQPHGWQPGRLLCSWGFSRQKYWSRLLCLPPGEIPNLGFEARSPALQADSLLCELPGKPKNTEVGNIHSPEELSTPGIELGSPALQADSLPAELQGKPKGQFRHQQI